MDFFLDRCDSLHRPTQSEEEAVNVHNPFHWLPVNFKFNSISYVPVPFSCHVACQLLGQLGLLLFVGR